MKRLIVICCLLLFLASTMASTKIVFTSERDGDGLRKLYVMDDDGNNITLLDDNWRRPYSPAWSPNGKQIVFDRHRVGFFLMNADDTKPRQITDYKDGNDFSPVFSPDSKYILFHRTVSIPPSPKHSINVMNIASGDIKKISDVNVASLDWSPDGQNIVYSTPIRTSGGGNNLYIMDIGGNRVRKLLLFEQKGDWNFSRRLPKWSPDGKRILYVEQEFKWEKTPQNTIALIRKAFRYILCDQYGRTVMQLNIPENWLVWDWVWIDNGKSVVFTMEPYVLNAPPPKPPYPPINMYKYHIATEKITRLTEHAGSDYSLDWISDDVLSVSPVGKQPIQWGKLKAFLNTRIEVLKGISSSHTDYLIPFLINLFIVA